VETRPVETGAVGMGAMGTCAVGKGAMGTRAVGMGRWNWQYGKCSVKGRGQHQLLGHVVGLAVSSP
jgi:hypothetical protein